MIHRDEQPGCRMGTPHLRMYPGYSFWSRLWVALKWFLTRAAVIDRIDQEERVIHCRYETWREMIAYRSKYLFRLLTKAGRSKNFWGEP